MATLNLEQFSKETRRKMAEESSEVELLIRFLKDQDKDVRLNALESLKKRTKTSIITPSEAHIICNFIRDKKEKEDEQFDKSFADLLEMLTELFFEALETKEYETYYDWTLTCIAKNPLSNENTLKKLTHLTHTEMLIKEIAEQRLLKMKE